MSDVSYWLEPGKVLTVASDGSSGTLTRLADQPGGGADLGTTSIAADETVAVGPFAVATRWAIPEDFTYSVASGYGASGEDHSFAEANEHFIPRDVVGIFDDFLYQASFTEADKPWILNAGSDDVAVDPAINAQEGGVIRLTSGDAGTGVAADGSQIACAVPFQADSGGLVFETRLHVNSAVTTVQVVAGLTDVTTLELPAAVGSSDAITTTLSNGCVFVFDTDADTDEWFAVGVNGDTDATGNGTTGVAPVADTYQTLRIEVDDDGASARFYVNGTLEKTLTANATSATTNLYATVLVNATTTTSRTVDVDYIYVGANR